MERFYSISMHNMLSFDKVEPFVSVCELRAQLLSSSAAAALPLEGIAGWLHKTVNIVLQ
jgi:hypothetical protein